MHFVEDFKELQTKLLRLIITLYHCRNVVVKSCKNTSPCAKSREVVGRRRRWRKSDTVRYILLKNNRGSRYSHNEKCLFLSRLQWLLLIAAFIITSCSILGFETDNTANITAASRLQIIFCNSASLLASFNNGFRIQPWERFLQTCRYFNWIHLKRAR